MLEIKEGVTLLGLCPQLLVALIVLERLYAESGHACVITAGNDGNHSSTSEHYAGRAVDIRTRVLTSEESQRIASRAQAALGRDFAVLLETDHIHVHYRPKKPKERDDGIV